MILFVPAYDEATRPNLAVAKLLTGSMHQVFEANATRAALWQILDYSQNMPLIAMSHGQRRFLRAQHGVAPHAIAAGDEFVLGTRHVFAWACLTSADLGIAAAKQGTTWFGFPVRIAAPPEHPRLQMMLARVLQIAVCGIGSVHDELTCRALLDQLVEYADAALMEIEVLRESKVLQDSDFDSVVQQCFEQFQLRLEAWLPGSNSPIRPTLAPTKRYDDLDPARDL